jgi:hypothetical protein
MANNINRGRVKGQRARDRRVTLSHELRVGISKRLAKETSFSREVLEMKVVKRLVHEIGQMNKGAN